VAFQRGFDAGLDKVQLLFMQSDGGLAPVNAFSGHKAILSGPAGGYVGYALTTAWSEGSGNVAAAAPSDATGDGVQQRLQVSQLCEPREQRPAASIYHTLFGHWVAHVKHP
jgi:hypothetical protein